jgi:hypothetical protein
MTFENFIKALKEGERNFFTLLNKTEFDFSEASFELLMENTDDVLSGVNKVLICNTNVNFCSFENCLIKFHDNDDEKLVLYSTTNDTSLINEIAGILISELGIGIYDDKEYASFKDFEQITDISEYNINQDIKDVVQFWRFLNLSFVLQYKVSPLQQFSLMITKSVKKEIDISIRRKGTVLDFMTIDLIEIFNQEELIKNEEIENGEIKFIDYIFLLDKLQFDIFNIAKIRIFNNKRQFNKNVYTNFFLTSTDEITSEKKIKISELLIKLYGQDVIGSEDIALYEREQIENNEFWIGRTWRFTESHSLLTSGNSNIRQSYEIRVANDETDGFELSILGFNELVALFGLS